MPPANADFSFSIKFAKGQGDPRRVFDAASSLIDGFEQLDEAVADSVDVQLKTVMVLEDVEAGSIKVFLRTLLGNIDDEGLKSGDYKKAIGPALVRAKYLALEYLDKDEADATKSIDTLRQGLKEIAEQTDVKHLPAYAPVHEARLVASLDRIQDAKRTLGPKDRLSIEADGRVYEVDLTKTWDPSEIVPVKPATETHSEAELFLTIRKPDLLGGAMWQFRHGKFNITASIQDEGWLADLHDQKIALHSGDALRCKVQFTYVYDEAGALIEQKTAILKVMDKVSSGRGEQLAFL